MTDERATNDSGGGQPAPTEEENEQAVGQRAREEEDMRSPQHADPDTAREQQVSDE